MRKKRAINVTDHIYYKVYMDRTKLVKEPPTKWFETKQRWAILTARKKSRQKANRKVADWSSYESQDYKLGLPFSEHMNQNTSAPTLTFVWFNVS